MTILPHTARRTALAAAVLLATAALPWPAAAQPAVATGVRPGAPAALPFAPGEACTYRASGPLGRMGGGTMAVEAGGRVDGSPTWLLRFDFRGRIGPVAAEDRTRSWLDPVAMRSLRYTKHERSPISSTEEDVRMDPAGRRWTGAEGESGALASDLPLDELSFLYFLRTLSLRDGETHTLTRHYHTERNPVVVRVTGRERVRVPAGEFDAIVVEMRVRDPDRYGGQGVVRLHVADDASRLLLRIESQVPRAGRMVLSLQELTPRCTTARPTALAGAR
jgi:hypothetical protein